MQMKRKKYCLRHKTSRCAVVTDCDTKVINDEITNVSIAGKKITVKVEDNSPASLRKRTDMKTRIKLD